MRTRRPGGGHPMCQLQCGSHPPPLQVALILMGFCPGRAGGAGESISPSRPTGIHSGVGYPPQLPSPSARWFSSAGSATPGRAAKLVGEGGAELTSAANPEPTGRLRVGPPVSWPSCWSLDPDPQGQHSVQHPGLQGPGIEGSLKAA